MFSTKSHKVSIELARSDCVYQPGEKVIGNAILENVCDQSITSVMLTAKGYSLVESPKLSSLCRKGDQDETYFKFTMALHHQDDEYEKGHHYFPFEFVLPKEIPHEYKGIYGRVEYFVEVVFNDTWSAKVLVRVLTTLVVPHDAEKQIVREEKMKIPGKCCFSTGGTITAHASTNHQGYMPGQTILINAHIKNDTGRAMQGSRLVLEQKTVFYSSAGKRKSLRVLWDMKGESFNQSYDWCDQPIVLPTDGLYPTNLPYCSIIDVRYRIKLIVQTGSFYKPLILKLNIFLGTTTAQAESNTLALELNEDLKRAKKSKKRNSRHAPNGGKDDARGSHVQNFKMVVYKTAAAATVENIDELDD